MLSKLGYLFKSGYLDRQVATYLKNQNKYLNRVWQLHIKHEPCSQHLDSRLFPSSLLFISLFLLHLFQNNNFLLIFLIFLHVSFIFFFFSFLNYNFLKFKLMQRAVIRKGKVRQKKKNTRGKAEKKYLMAFFFFLGAK